MTERTHKAVTIILCLLAGIALGVAFSGFEIPMAYPGGAVVKDSFTAHPDKPEGGWTEENMPRVAPDNDRGIIAPIWKQPDDPASLQEQVDRMQFELDVLKGRLREIPELKLKVMDLEGRIKSLERILRDAMKGS